LPFWIIAAAIDAIAISIVVVVVAVEIYLIAFIFGRHKFCKRTHKHILTHTHKRMLRDLCDFYKFYWVNLFVLYLLQLYAYVIYVAKIVNLCIQLL